MADLIVTVGKTSFTILAADVQTVAPAWGTVDDVEPGLVNEFKALFATRLAKQVADAAGSDAVQKLQEATPDAKKDASKFLDFTPEQRAVAFAAVGLASNVATPDSPKP